jgi:hypothetical protein
LKQGKFNKGYSAVSPEFTPGMVLVRPGVELPSFASRCVQKGMPWDVLSGIGAGDMEFAMRNEGWSFFYIVPGIVVRAISVWCHQAIHKALRRAIKAVETQGVNAVEVVSIRVSRILGVSFVKIAAQPRHVSPRPSAFDLKPNRWATWQPETRGLDVPERESTFSLAA